MMTQDNLKQRYIEECAERFKSLLSDKKRGVNLEDREARMQGFLNAGDFLGLITRDEINALFEQTHLNVFNETVAKRKARKQHLNTLAEHSDLLEIPTIERNKDIDNLMD